MRSLDELLRLNKAIRVMGFDDAPFQSDRGAIVHVAGVICANTRFEGMLWSDITKDGTDATGVIINSLSNSKFYRQVNVVLVDGIALGGFNIIDLPRLAEELERPCIAVMRKSPDLTAVDAALRNFSDYTVRKKLLEKAGTVYTSGYFCYQAKGCHAETAARVLEQLTDRGHVPEALRLAHLIGSAIVNGESSNRA